MGAQRSQNTCFEDVGEDLGKKSGPPPPHADPTTTDPTPHSRPSEFLGNQFHIDVCVCARVGQRVLRTRRPLTGVFGPFGPEVPLRVSERVSPKIGVCPKVSGEVPLGPF